MPPTDPEPQHAPAARNLNIRRTGLLIATGLGLLSTGVILLLVARAGQNAQSAVAKGPASPAGVERPPTDVTQVGLRKGGKARVQFVDRNDPSRTAGQMEWSSLDPLESGYALVKNPTGTVFLRDGAVILVMSASARLYTPPRASEPESGTFEGQVTIRLFQPLPDGSIDVNKDAPALTFVTRGLAFDLTLGEIVTRDAWTLDSPSITASGKGIRALGNQVRSRIELLELQQTDRVTFDPTATRNPRADRPLADRPPAPEPTFSPKPPEPLITLYRATFSDEVKLAQAGRSVNAEQLQVFLRLIDNHFADNALAGISPPPPPQKPQASAPGPTSPAVPADGQIAAAPSVGPVSNKPVTLTWTGPMVLRPLDATPKELEHQEVLARFTAEGSGLVHFADPAIGAAGSAPVLTYGATTRSLDLSGPAADSVTLTMGPRGSLSAQTLTQNLGTGVGHITGPGSVTLWEGAPSPPGEPTVVIPPRTIAWHEQADFVFMTSSGWMTGDLKQAIFQGDTRASDARASLTGNFLRADFVETGTAPDKREPRRTVLSRLAVHDNAVADGGEAGSLHSQTLDVAFTPTPDGRASDPSFVIASGGVTTSRNGETLRADRVEASLARDDQNHLALRVVEAEQNVTFTGRDGASAAGDRLVADVTRQQVELFGPTATVSSQGATVLSRQIHIDALARTLDCPGGIFRLVRPAESMPDGSTRQAVSLETTWSRTMHVDDKAGTAEAIGDAVAMSSGSPDEIDTVRSERISLVFTPFAPVEPGKAAPQRRLVRAEAIGSIVDREGGRPAVVESRRYAPLDAAAIAHSPGVDATGRKLERLLYAESARLIDDEAEGIIRLPQAGRLLVDDRREPPAPAAPGDKPAPADMRPANSNPGTPAILPVGGTRGTTLFTWAGDAKVTRATGIAELNREVRMIHRAEATDPVTTLDCQRAEAHFVIPGGTTATDAPRSGQLLRAIALGGVQVDSDHKSLQAESLLFDAVLNQITAEAGPGSRVTYLDPQQGTPQSARKLIWKLGVHPEVRVVEPLTNMPR